VLRKRRGLVVLFQEEMSAEWQSSKPPPHLLTSGSKMLPLRIMSLPVKLSDSLVIEARMVAAVMERSIAGQVEFWAGLGRSIEPLLSGDRAVYIKCMGKQRSLTEAIFSVDSDSGRERLRAYLDARPFPHFEACPDRAGFLVKIDEDGTRTRGRFVNRAFVADTESSAS
jgi:hypothetical protein